MTMPPRSPGLGRTFEEMTGMPSPDKVMAELQRLNYNMEMIQPDLHKLAQSLDGIKADDIRNLSTALHAVHPGDIMRALNQFNGLASQIYEQLWGKK